MVNSIETLGARLARERHARELSQGRLAEIARLSQRAISDLERGESAYTDRWRELADALGIPHEEMRALMLDAKRESGKVTRLPAAVRAAVRATNTPFFPPTDRTSPFSDRADQVPILGQAVGGDDGRMQFNGSIAGWAPRPISLLGVPDAYAVFVAGESMEPRYRAGETVWIHPRKPPHVGADVVVQLAPEEDGDPPSGFIKEYRGRNTETVLLRQYNPARDIKVDSSKVMSIHTVVLAER